jgi:hypothetical protein
MSVLGGSGSGEDSWIRPVKYDKHGPLYSAREIDAISLSLIELGRFFERRVVVMSKDAEAAIAKTEKVTAEFSQSLERFLAVERNFAEQSKRASGSIRDAGEKLAQGLAKVERAANFDRLDRYVELLERAASAMRVLAELESSGKLEKIAGAIR